MPHCSTCLSNNRRLTLLSSLKQVTPIVKLMDVNLSLTEDNICWECQAIFSRIKRFRSQIIKAQQTMKTWNKKAEIKKKNKTLSSLMTTTKDTYDAILRERYSLECSSIKKEDDFEIDCMEHNVSEEFKEDTNYDEDDANLLKMAEDEYKIKETTHLEKEIPTTVNSHEETEPLTINEEMIVESTNDEIKLESGDIITNEIDSEEADFIREDNKDINQELTEFKLTKDEENFTVTKMTMQELYKSRDVDREATVYKRCPFKCTKCIIGYYKEQKYERHLKDKHDSGPKGKKKAHICTICEVRFTRRDAAQTHYNKHFRRYSCKMCDYSHHKLATMLAHKSNEHDKEVFYSCGLCNKNFTHSSRLRYHNDVCHKEKAKCEICGKVTTTKYNLKIHMLVHQPKRVQCPDCGLLVRSTSLLNHRRSHSRPLDECAFCAECNKQQRCSYCDMAFTDKFSLTRHVASKHLNVYPFKCLICEKGFIRKDKIKIHMMERHDGIPLPKDKICNYCGKGFKMKASLRTHIRTHTGERPHACAHCPAAFSQPSTLKTHNKALHKNVHTNTKV